MHGPVRVCSNGRQSLRLIHLATAHRLLYIFHLHVQLSLFGRGLSAKTAGLHSTTSPCSYAVGPAHDWHPIGQAHQVTSKVRRGRGEERGGNTIVLCTISCRTDICAQFSRTAAEH